MNIIESTSDVMIASVKDKKQELILVNIYCSNQLPRARQTLLKVAKLLKENNTEKNIVFIGDWNKTPEELTKKLFKYGAHVYPTCAPITGTRISVDRRSTKRTVDYAVSNNSTLITNQKIKTNWRLSDHYPVLTSINIKFIDKFKDKHTVFDRKKLCLPKYANIIKNIDFNISSNDILINVQNFHQKIENKLKELKNS
ncbi:hypothetical protein GVAV_002530 [Gurleya vavrai]